jgi:hypothetical protein
MECGKYAESSRVGIGRFCGKVLQIELRKAWLGRRGVDAACTWRNHLVI